MYGKVGERRVWMERQHIDHRSNDVVVQVLEDECTEARGITKNIPTMWKLWTSVTEFSKLWKDDLAFNRT
jgi:hypothetical protein